MSEATQEASALEATGLGKRYGTREAARDIDLVVAPGEIHGLLGANGAGKTTLLRMLLGLARRDAGTVRLLGQDRPLAGAALPPGVAGYVDVTGFYPYLTGRQNLALLARLDDARGQVRSVSAEDVLASVGLMGHADHRVRGYSAGMRQRLALAATLLRRPRLLLLDEPTSSLDPVSARQVRGLVRELAAAGTAIVLSSHDLVEVEELCTRVTVLREGSVAFSGTVAALRARSSGATYRLQTGDDARALAIGEGQVDLEVRRDAVGAGLVIATSAAEIDEYTLALGRAGVGIRHLEQKKASLAELFLRLASGEPAPDDAASSSAPRSPPAAVPAAGRTVTARGVGATFAVECAKLARSWPARASLAVAILAPFVFALAMKVQATLPDDTLFGRWARTSGLASPLVILGFAAAWVFPVLASVVAGDMFSAETRERTWAAILTRSRSRGEVFVGKAVAALAFAAVAVCLLGVASVVAGIVLIGRQPLIGLTGTELPASAALGRIALAWLSVLPPVMGFTSVALLISVTTRSGIAGVGLPVLLGLAMELGSLLDGADAAHPFALTAPFVAWHGLFADPQFFTPLRDGIGVSAVYSIVCLTAAFVAFVRRDLET